MRFLSRALVLGLPLLALAGCGRRAAPDPIVLGQLVPLSGPDQAVGEHAREGAQLAIDDVNADGDGLAGRPLQVLHVNARREERVAPTARARGGEGADGGKFGSHAVRLITINRVVGLLSDAGPEAAEDAALAARPYGVPVISSAGPAGPTADNLVGLGLSPGVRGRVLARFVKDTLRPGRIVVIRAAGDRAAAAADRFSDEMVTGKAQLHYLTSHDLADTKARSAEVSAQHPDAVLVVGAGPGHLRSLRAAVTPGPVWLYAGDDGQQTRLWQDRTVSQGMYCVTPFLAEEGGGFTRRYHERFGRDPDVHAALAYDSVRLLTEGIKKAVSGGRVRDELLGLETFESVAGTLTLPRGQVARRPAFVVRVQDGAPKQVKRYDDAR
jgi:branched-chain amino acid transport system substrate-binding protein